MSHETVKRATITNKTIAELVGQFSGDKSILTIPRVFISLTQNDIWSAIFLSQCLYWSNRTHDGWFYKTAEDWEREIGISRRGLERARSTLKGIVQTELRGMPAKTYYRVNEDALIDALVAVLEQAKSQEGYYLEDDDDLDEDTAPNSSPPEPPEDPNQDDTDCTNVQTSLHETYKQDCTNVQPSLYKTRKQDCTQRTNKIVQKAQTNRDLLINLNPLTETTTETTAGGGVKHPSQFVQTGTKADHPETPPPATTETVVRKAGCELLACLPDSIGRETDNASTPETAEALYRKVRPSHLRMPRTDQFGAAVDILRQYLQVHKGDLDAAAQALRPFAEEAERREISPTNLCWLTEWAAVGQVPTQRRPSSRQKAAAPPPDTNPAPRISPERERLWQLHDVILDRVVEAIGMSEVQRRSNQNWESLIEIYQAVFGEDELAKEYNHLSEIVEREDEIANLPNR